MRFNVAGFGSVAGRGDSTEAFEDAIAAAKNSMLGRSAYSSRPASAVYVPDGGDAYVISRPLFLPPGVDLIGDGNSSQVNLDRYDYPVVIVGVEDPETTLDDRPLLTCLDTTVGSRWGFSTRGGRFLQVQHGPAWGRLQASDWLDYFEGVSTLTLDLCVESMELLPAGAPICGHGEGGTARPWLLSVGDDPTTWIFRVASTNVTESGTFDFGIVFPIPTSPGTVRLSVQANLADHRYAVWVNGLQVSCQISGSPAATVMVCNDWPLLFGIDGINPGFGSVLPTSMVVAGWRLDSIERYLVGDTDSPQARIDGQTITDVWQFFQPGCVGWLPLDDPPGRRWVDICMAGGNRSAGLVMKTGSRGGWPCRIGGLDLTSKGPGILIGTCAEGMVIERCRVRGLHGPTIGSWNVGPAYTLEISGSTRLGGPMPLSLWHTRASIDGLQTEGYGRYAISMRGGSISIRGAMLGPCSPGVSVSAVRWLPGQWGGRLRIEDMDVDNEGTPHRGPVIDAWQQPTEVAKLVIDGLYVADHGTQPMVRLNSWQNGQPASAKLDPCIVEGGDGWTYGQ